MNQVIVAYHAQARGEVVLSPELAEYRLFSPQDGALLAAGTGYALADWLRARPRAAVHRPCRRVRRIRPASRG
jgi:NAD+ diphosphatase